MIADRWKLNRSPHPKAFLERFALGLLKQGCIQFGDFVLKSGEASPFYLDLRRIPSSPSLFKQATSALTDIVIRRRLSRYHLAGIPQAGVPFAAAVAISTRQSLLGPRKGAKTYGARSLVDGVYERGDSVILIDDVISTGLSKLETLSVLSSEGLKTDCIVVLIDRQRASFELPCEVQSVFQMGSLLDIWEKHGQITASDMKRARAFLAEER
jgi:uridine monophosphate synthetase